MDLAKTTLAMALLVAAPAIAQPYYGQPPAAPPYAGTVPGREPYAPRSAYGDWPAGREGVQELRDSRGRYLGETRPDGYGGREIRGPRGEYRGDVRPR